MRDNLVFTGIPESNLPQRETENCGIIIKDFLRKDMRIEKEFHFDRVHRLESMTPNRSTRGQS